MSKIKPFEKLKFHDDFMFGLVMQDKKLCRDVLECLLGIKIRHLEYATRMRALIWQTLQKT